MAYTVYDSIEVPYDIGLYRYVSGDSRLYGSPQTLVGVKSSMDALGIGWRAQQAVYQVQWCYMRRLVPSEAILVDPSGSDVWYGWNGDLTTGSRGNRDTWGDWQGVDLNDEVKSPTTPAAYQGVPGTYAVDSSIGAYDPWQLPIDTSTAIYDLTKIQVRVRTFWSWYTPKRVSNWAYKEITLAPIPTINAVTAVRNEDGTVTVTVDTDLTRGGNLLTGKVVDTASAVGGADPSITFDRWDGGETVTVTNLKLTTGDGISVNIGTQVITVTDPEPATPIAAPTVTVDAQGAVEVVEGEAYDSVRVRATYTDIEGHVYDEEVEMVYDGEGAWTGAIPTPPLDVPVDVLVSYVVGDEWNYTTTSVTVPSEGRIMLDWGDSHFALRYNVYRSYSNDLSSDVVSIAGKELPVSRHGSARTVKMTINGTVVNPAKLPAVGDMWLGELNVLNEPHDWILRLPGGMRRQIAIETWVPQFQDKTCDTIANVTITANEVQQ